MIAGTYSLVGSCRVVSSGLEYAFLYRLPVCSWCKPDDAMPFMKGSSVLVAALFTRKDKLLPTLRLWGPLEHCDRMRLAPA